jgi:putative phage-type endonuclease
MKTLNLIQGSQEWLAHRAKCRNASDAPAMMGVSPYKTRRALLRELKTGVPPEVDDGTRKRFAHGHRLEALARPYAEQIVGCPLYPVTGVLEGTDPPLSASFDGLTMDETVGFEHKALNDELRAAFAEMDRLHASGSADVDAWRSLPRHHQIQCQQQLLVCQGDYIVFMASQFDDAGTLTEEHHCYVWKDDAIQADIRNGWQQFEADLAAFELEESREPAPVGSSPESLPALLTLATDQDFADAEQSVKWCREVESRIEAAKQHALAQTATIDELFRTLDDIAAESKRVRLDLEKRVKNRKEEIKSSIVLKARSALDHHVATINAELAPFRVPFAMPDLANEIKGKRSIDAMEDSLDAAVAAGKIAADSAARVVRANVVLYRREAEGMEFLFADVGQHIAKPEADFAELVTSRIERHRAAEEARKAREEAERLRREAEAAERNRVEAESKRKYDEELRSIQEERAAIDRLGLTPKPIADDAEPVGDPDEPATLNLSAINTRLGFTLSLGFIGDTLDVRATGGTKRSPMFTETQFRVMCGRLRDHLRTFLVVREEVLS